MVNTIEPKEMKAMLTTSEIVATALLWVLTAAGCFFGVRGMLRRKKMKGSDK